MRWFGQTLKNGEVLTPLLVPKELREFIATNARKAAELQLWKTSEGL
jgi:hypothetical protein